VHCVNSDDERPIPFEVVRLVKRQLLIQGGGSMQRRSVVKIGVMLICLGFTVCGCSKFLKPELGAVAKKEARIPIAEAIPASIWQAGELRTSYSFAEKEGMAILTGNIVFDRSISYSFPVIARFFFYISYVDEAGRVLASFDITPIIPTYGSIPENLPLKAAHPLPPGSKAFVFHYYGEFRSNPINEGGQWTIHHFPFD